MTCFAADQGRPEDDRPAAALPAIVPVPFSSREIALAVGFVAARVRLFNELHNGWMTDSSAFADLLTLLPWPADLGGPPGPRFVRVRLEEPVPGIGVVTYPLSWGTDDGSGRLVPVLDMGLRLRAGWPGQTFLRLAALPGCTLATSAPTRWIFSSRAGGSMPGLTSGWRGWPAR